MMAMDGVIREFVCWCFFFPLAPFSWLDLCLVGFYDPQLQRVCAQVKRPLKLADGPCVDLEAGRSDLFSPPFSLVSLALERRRLPSNQSLCSLLFFLFPSRAVG